MSHICSIAPLPPPIFHLADAKECVAVCCSVLQCVAVCCSVLQYIDVCCSVLQRVAARCSALHRVAARCSVFLLLLHMDAEEWVEVNF